MISNENTPCQSLISMRGGQDEASYFTNSNIQLRMANATRPMLKDLVNEILEQGNAQIGEVFNIADTGCATGANTLLAAEAIVRFVSEKCHSHSIPLPEFHVFFSDLPSNDFNTLLRTLPPKVQNRQNGLFQYNKDGFPTNRAYFASCVCGSHHGRLLPRKSLNFCHSFMSLHWLSRVPREVEDRESPAWNKGHVFVKTDATSNAYLKQFTDDVTSFLRARAEEIIPGGALFIGFIGRQAGDQRKQGWLGVRIQHIENALKEMIQEGVVDESVIDDFNFPMYAATTEEFCKIVETEGSFDTKEARCVAGIDAHVESHVKKGEEVGFGVSLERRFRSLFESVVAANLRDEGLVNDLYGRLRRRATTHPQSFIHDKVALLAISLTRKID